MKTCLRCKNEKETTEFGREARRSDGLRPYCKDCCKAMIAEYRKEDSYRANERFYAREYNKDFKEERKEYRKGYEKDPETKAAIQKQKSGWQRKSPEKLLLYAARARARKGGLPFDLEITDIVIPEVCPILGIRLEKGDRCVCETSPSIDQIIPNKGYVKTNFQIISFRANTIKNDATLEELKRVVAYLENLKK